MPRIDGSPGLEAPRPRLFMCGCSGWSRHSLSSLVKHQMVDEGANDQSVSYLPSSSSPAVSHTLVRS
jgi:hypothetical protein